MTRKKWHVGARVDNGAYEVFSSLITPEASTHGNVYKYAIGPFRTKRGATFYTNTVGGSSVEDFPISISTIEREAKEAAAK